MTAHRSCQPITEEKSPGLLRAPWGPGGESEIPGDTNIKIPSPTWVSGDVSVSLSWSSKGQGQILVLFKTGWLASSVLMTLKWICDLELICYLLPYSAPPPLGFN